MEEEKNSWLDGHSGRRVTKLLNYHNFSTCPTNGTSLSQASLPGIISGLAGLDGGQLLALNHVGTVGFERVEISNISLLYFLDFFL